LGAVNNKAVATTATTNPHFSKIFIGSLLKYFTVVLFKPTTSERCREHKTSISVAVGIV
jgi:hypothetical protein